MSEIVHQTPSFGPPLQVLTFEGTSADALYDMTVEIPPRNLILVNSKLITTGTIPDSIVIEIDSTVSNEYVVDNIPQANYFRYSVRYNPVTISMVDYNYSQYKPMIGYKMSSAIHRQCRFVLRNSSTGAVLTNVSYFFFQFQVIG